VQRALQQLHEFGFVNWTRRLIRNAWRCEQTYVLTLPQAAILFHAPSLNQMKRTFSRRMNVAGEAHNTAVLASLNIAVAQAVLLRRRLAMEAALMAGRGERRETPPAWQ
jgi:hypothetical protein